MDDATRQALQDAAQALWPRESGSEPPAFVAPTAPFEEPRVVGLGRPGDGSRGATRVQLGLLRYLIEDCEFRVIGFDGEFASALALDAYVAGDVDTRASALNQLRSSPWEGGVGHNFLEWLREFNADRAAGDRVRVTGLDARRPASIISCLRSYFEGVDPAFLETVEHNLHRIEALSQTVDMGTEEGLSLTSHTDQDDAREELIAEADRLVPSLRERLEDQESSYVSTSGRREWERATHLVTLLEAAVAVQRPPAQQASGDIEAETARQRVQHLAAVGMADNVDWVLGFEAAASMAILAPDDTVAREEHRDEGVGVGIRLLGSVLAARYGDAYCALKTDSGTAAGSEGTYGDGTVTTNSSGFDVLASTLARVDAPAALLDFGRARSDDSVAEWLDDTEVEGSFDGYCTATGH
jgi:erythromycin esterase-like protein